MRGRCSRAFCHGALDRGLVAANPCERGGRLYRGSRAEKIWTAADEAAFLERAPAHLHLPLLLALWTGQRQGDLLRLPWSAYDGTHIRLRQSKTGSARRDPGRRAAQGRARRRTEAQPDHPDQQRWQAVDIGRLPRLMGQGVQAGWRGRRDVSRPARHCGHAARPGRKRPRPRSRPSPGTRCASVHAILDTHYLEPRSCARRERDPKARKGNKISQLTSQLVWDVLCEEGEKPSEINGGRTRARTWDPLIKSQLLYQLSYAP